MSIPLSSVSLSGLELGYVQEALHRGVISGSGEYVSRFEHALAQRIGVKVVTAVNSGTSALQLVLKALGIGPGDEVIVPALTFAAPASAVVSVGATPAFADISEESWTLDSREVQRVRTAHTKAIIAVDLLGHPCHYDDLNGFGLPIVEDAAQAHGASYRGTPVGRHGRAGIFSFHANKAISTGEGGCVATNDTSLDGAIRLLKNHGMTKDRPYWHSVPGWNCRITNVAAAIGLGQVERWDELISARLAVSKAYIECLDGLPIASRPVAHWATATTWLHTITSQKRDEILTACRRRRVDARAIWPPLPHVPAFRFWANGDYPVASAVSQRALWLPTWAGMTKEEINSVRDAVAEGCGRRS